MSQTPRLDRLSAILAGLAPCIEVFRYPQGMGGIEISASSDPLLYLYLIAQGEMCLSAGHNACQVMQAPAMVICRADQAHSISVTQDGEVFSSLMCAKASLRGPAADLFLREFSRPLVLSLAEADASLLHITGLIASELQSPRCGQPALLDRAGDILFIGLLRYLVAHPVMPHGLFNALADQRIAHALVAMHSLPHAKWTLDSLAVEAGMSRTAFAIKFRETMNQPPGKYLGQLRLSIARRAMQSGLGLKRAAQDAGYTNTSALSRALSRMSASA